MKNVYVLSAQLGSLPVFNLMGVFKTREEAEEQAKNENYPYSEHLHFHCGKLCFSFSIGYFKGLISNSSIRAVIDKYGDGKQLFFI